MVPTQTYAFTPDFYPREKNWWQVNCVYQGNEECILPKTPAVRPQCLVTRSAHGVHVCHPPQVLSRRSEGRERLYVFIKSTREQLRGLCSLDTPHLFIIIPPAVTLPFILACWLICSSSLKNHTRLLGLQCHTAGVRGRIRNWIEGMCQDVARYVCVLKDAFM